MSRDILEHVRHYLPAQGPIKDFIHHNTLHAFQDRPFDKAVTEASDFYGTRAYMTSSYYQQAYSKGRISESEIGRAKSQHKNGLCEPSQPKFAKIRHLFDEQHSDLDWDAQINPILFRVVSGFLDQGITLWHFPRRDESFFEAVAGLINDSALPLCAFVEKQRCATWFKMAPGDVVDELLSKIVGDSIFHEAYVKDTLMAHPGWSGMVNAIENRPSCLLRQRTIRLLEFLAFKLILEWEFIETHCSHFVPLSEVRSRNVPQPTPIDDSEIPESVWHNALEMTCYKKILSALKVHNTNSVIRQGADPTIQVVFCIDDRECSFRRHLEEVNPRIETFGWAGFFGMDFFFQSLNDAVPVQMCPPVITPKYLVKEIPRKGEEDNFLKQKALTMQSALSLELWRDATSSIFLGFLAANTLGHMTIFRLIMSFFHPKQLLASLKSRTINIQTELTVLRPQEEIDQGECLQGFTYEEMGTRVESVLRGMGLTQNFAPVIFFLAHGSSSVNNPHFAAYDCGACSGRPGAPNARVLAHMANLAQVRKGLIERGFIIPAATQFVGGYHDTATDAVIFFDQEKLSAENTIRANNFLKDLEEVRKRNARERCRKFAVVDLDISEEDAVHEVSKRTHALFEPRPELGHATNVSCIIGQRAITRGLFLDRRAFLNSYDPFNDETGAVLTQILSAAIPVCGGINLEYYFSRVDPGKYGCGTKLSHNVCGLLGVCNGIDDDLRTGLPVQMTEIHDPVRLLIVVQQDPEIILRVLRKNPELLEWVDNEWVRLASMHPISQDMSLYFTGKGFCVVQDLDMNPTVYPSSFDCYKGSREPREIAQIKMPRG